MRILEANNISKYFGGLKALNDVSFHVDAGEILGIIGPNGSGKTTMFNVLSGRFKPSRGRIIFRGEDITGLAMNQVNKKGLVRTFQEISVWKEETVLDNLLLAAYQNRKAGLLSWLANTRNAQQENLSIMVIADKIMEYMRILDLKGEVAKNLPHGKLRALGVCIALITEPKMLLLDEPVTGMNPVEKSEMVELVKGLRKQGVTVIIIEHDMATIMNLVDRLIVLEEGRKIAEGVASEILRHPAVVEAYLGSEEKY